MPQKLLQHGSIHEYNYIALYEIISTYLVPKMYLFSPLQTVKLIQIKSRSSQP